MSTGQLPEFENILLERDEALTWITLNRPDRLNAMNPQMLDELEAGLEALRTDDDTRVVAIRGAGRAFSAGYDVERKPGPHVEPDIVDDYERLHGQIARFLKLWDFPKPIIAAVHGYCLAGATQLCVSCDITVVADDAVIGLPEIPMGGGYITPMWVPLVGVKRAKQMSFMAGSRISGVEASQWGWANYSVPADELEANVASMAHIIARTPAKVLQMKKVALNRVADVMGFRTTALMGAETDALLHFSEPVQEMRASIREHGLKEAIAQFKAEP